MKAKYLFIIVLCSILLPRFSEAQIKSIKLVVSITGSIINYDTRDYATIRYQVYDSAGKRVARGKSNAVEKGYYFVTGLKPGQTYWIKFFDMKYLRMEYKFSIPYTDKYTEYSKDFLVVPRKQSLKLTLSVPPFERGKKKLRYGIEDFLDFYAKIVVRNPRIKFEIQCFPDKADETAKNLALTEGRAQTIKNYFVSRGAKEEKIYTQGSATLDKDNPPPVKKRSKGHHYIGTTYLALKQIK